jgi:PIN domain nuclease of toxin-antitoxin system
VNAALDASALLAYLQDEPGSDAVEAVLAGSAMSSVNWAEVVQKSVASNVAVDNMLGELVALGLSVLPFTPADAEMTGRLWMQTKKHGLSLGDRACLSMGLRLGIPVLTTDRIWAKLSLPLEIRVVR